MEKIHFSIVINAPKDKVWNTMLGADTYSEWTEVFAHGSYYVGDWTEGNKMLFLAPDETGKISGMVGFIKENKPFEFLSIENIGEYEEGKEEVKEWAGAQENYTFKEVDGKTEVSIDIDTNEDFKELFQDTWPEALRKLRKLAER
jgi:hypothetical protein